MSLIVYTDGSCRGNPGPGGWAYRIEYSCGKAAVEASGFQESTTNNRMELTACIEALAGIDARSSVVVRTDSRYITDGLQSWIPQWKLNGWKTKTKTAVKNQDLWQRLDALVQRLTLVLQCPLSFEWVKAHNGDPGNERVDALAKQAHS